MRSLGVAFKELAVMELVSGRQKMNHLMTKNECGRMFFFFFARSGLTVALGDLELAYVNQAGLKS